MKKVLITGIDSFTGRYLDIYLKNLGYEIYGTSLFTKNENIYSCDITNKEDIKKVFETVQPDYLIHLSGISFTHHARITDFYDVNTIGTVNILQVISELHLNPKKIILASSASVYGNQGLEILDESLCPKPNNHYGVSKHAMECLSKNYFDKLNIIIVRPFNYTGIGQASHFLIPKIVQHFKEKKQIIQLGNINVSREFNDISYVCEIYSRLLENESKSEVVNIASNRGIKLLDIIECMNEITNYKIDVQINQEFVREDEIMMLTGSCEKLFGLIGNVQQKTIKQTLLDMLYA